MSIINTVVSIVFAALLALLALTSAYKAGYFKLPALNKPSSIDLADCFQLFLLFMTLQFVVFPLILYWGFVKGNEALLDFEFTGWLNLGAIFGMTLVVGLFLFFKRPQIHTLFTSSQPLFDLWLGVTSWLIAFPSALLISQILVLILTDFLGYTLQDQSAVMHMKKSLENPDLFMATVLAVVFVVPILEEIIFRGYLQTSLRKYLSPQVSILISSSLFAWFHFSQGQGVNNFNILFSLFVLALFLGFLRERQGNLLSSIALHSTFNGVSVALIFFGSETSSNLSTIVSINLSNYIG